MNVGFHEGVFQKRNQHCILAYDHCPFKTCRISFNFLRLAILNDSLCCFALVMSFLTTLDVSLISLNLCTFSFNVSRHPCTTFLFWTLSSYLVTKFTLVNRSINPMTVSQSLLESMYSGASLKQSPIKSSMLLLKCFRLWFRLLRNETRDRKSEVVFSLVKACLLTYSCMIFKYFDTIPKQFCCHHPPFA